MLLIFILFDNVYINLMEVAACAGLTITWLFYIQVRFMFKGLVDVES